MNTRRQTQHGTEDLGGAGGWLDDVAKEAAAAGLGVHIGLHWDPQWFNRLTDGHTPLADYGWQPGCWRELRVNAPWCRRVRLRPSPRERICPWTDIGRCP